MNEQLDRTLIAYALGPLLLGAYALGARAAQALRGVTYALMLGLLPAISDLNAVGDRTRLRFLYLRSTRYLASVDLPLFGGGLVLAYPLVAAWLGAGHSRIAITMGVLLLAYAIGLPAHATDQALNGIGRPDIRMRADLVLLPFHLCVCLVLIWRFGYFGTLAGTVFTYSANRIYLYWAGSHAIGVSWRELFLQGFLHAILGTLLASISVLVIQLLGAPLTIPMLILELATFCAVYAAYIFAFGLDSYDRGLLRSFVGPASARVPFLRAIVRG